MGYQNLQTRFLPHFEQNRVQITTTYIGASANLVETSITTPIEKAISGINGIDYVTSLSAQGSSSITAILDSGVNIYNVTSKIRNTVAMAASTLPSTIQSPVIQEGYHGIDLMDIGFTIQGASLHSLRDYLDRYVINRIEEQSGISAVVPLGANKYAMRITLHPTQMAARKININEIQQAIQNSNLQLPAGSIQTSTMQFPVTAKTSLKTVKQFGDIVIKNDKGQLIRLKDIATIKLGSDLESKSFVHINGTPGILLSVYPTNQANPITAAKQLRALLARISTQFPSNIHYAITFDESNFMNDSIHEVYKSIALSILFVAIIIFFTLGKIRSSFIPIVTIPVCILATMGMMYFAGFSINIITLLAIVLSVGLVVDDAIVVLENIHRHMENGLTRIEAALKGSQEIATPVIAMTLTLAAVYAPIGLIQGVVAHIFASFAFTLAIAVIISGFVALTLSPMMCSKFLVHDAAPQNTLNKNIENFFHALTFFYKKLLTHVLMHRLKIVIITIILAIAGFAVAYTLEKTFLPKEDMGFLITLLKTPAGSSNQSAQQNLKKINQLLLSNPAVDHNVGISFVPASSRHNNITFTALKNYGERNESADEVAQWMNKQVTKIPGLNAISFAPSFGGSTQNAIEFYITAPNSYHYLFQVGNALIKKLNNYPGLINMASNMQYNNQQYNLTVNRTLANQLNVNISTIDNTIAAMLGGTQVSTFNVGGETYDVDMQVAKPYLQSVQSMEQLSVPNAAGQLIPLTNLISVKPVPTQTNLLHYNRLRAASIAGEIAPGYTLGEVVAYLQKSLPTLLPSHVKYTFMGQARRIITSSNSMGLVFLLAFIFIYLVLSAQFESFVDPLIILLAVPLSIIGALVSLKMVNGSINLYTMIGLITLVGLIAKHGILITQFANTLQKSGENAHDALVHAASIRLRPILMTTAAMIFGALPLVFSSGASAVSREQIGTVFVGGLLCGTFFSLILVPISYSYFNQLKAFIKRKK